MTRNNLLVFIVFLFNSLTKTLEVDYTDNVSQELIVSHYDCTKVQDNRMYSLNKVAESKISPENLYIARLLSHSIKKIIEPTYQQHCVLSRSMYSDTIVECFHIRHTCMTKIASLMT